MKRNQYQNPSHRRRGVTIVQTVVCSTVLAGFAALAVDVGQLCAVRADLQNAADSAALAGASAYFSEAGLAQNYNAMEALVQDRAGSYSFFNESFAANGTFLDPSDVLLAAFDFNNRLAPLDPDGSPRFNAVQVKVRRASDSSNGSVLFAFARVFGMNEGSVSATGVAAIDDRFAGFRILEDNYPEMLPFTIDVHFHDLMVASQNDNFSYADGEVVHESDGIGEVSIYPWKTDSTGKHNVNDGGSGNFGLLNFEVKTNGDLHRQIENGLTPDEVENAIGTSSPLYYDDAGDPITYPMSGEPGLRASLADSISERIGDVIGYFVHDSVSGSGSNTVYRNVGVRFGRVMEITLNGSMSQKRLVVQPVAYTGSSVIVSDSAPSSGGMVGRIRLVR